MGDTAEAQAPAAAPVVAPVVASPEERQAALLRDRDEARKARRATAISKIHASHAAAAEAPVEEAPEPIAPAKPTLAPAKPTEAPKLVAEVKPTDAKPVESGKTDSAADDAATQRGLAQIERARKNFLDERSAKEEELSRREARIAARENDVTGKVSSIEELKKLPLSTMLDRLGLDDTALVQLSRESYYRTSEGQKNPSAKQAVEEVRQRSSMSTLEQRVEALTRELAETKESAIAAQRLVFQREHANEWVEGALKAVPADKPSLFALLQAKNPREARNKLLAIGGELEKSGGGEAPNAAEVFAEYEKRQRELLESQGIDVERLLVPAAPAKAAAPAPAVKPARTLAPGSTQIVRPESVPTTREERRTNAVAKIRMRQRQTADEVH